MCRLTSRPCPLRAPLLWLPLLTLLLATVDREGCGSTCGTAGDELIAAEVGLTREWIVQIPFDSAGWRLGYVVVGDRLVVAQSGDGGVHAVQAAAEPGQPRAGSVVWSQRIGTPGGPMVAAGIGPEIVTVARDLDLYALDSRTGRVTWHEPLARPPALSAVPSGDWVYMPLATEGVLRLPVDPFRDSTAKRAATATDAAGSDAGDKAPAKDAGKGKKRGPPVAAPESLAPLVIGAGGEVAFAPQPIDGGVVWCTRNKVVAMERKPFGWVRREHEAGAAVATQPLIRGRSLFVAFTPGELRRIDLDPPESQRLRSTWRTPLPDRAVGGPLLAGDTVVLSLGPSGIAGFAAATGAPVWRKDLVGTLVAVCGDRVWLIDEIDRLTGLDPATGEVRTSLCLGCLSMPVVNTATERLVLASPGGLLVSLAPAAASIAPATTPRKPQPAKDDMPAEEQPEKRDADTAVEADAAASTEAGVSDPAAPAPASEPADPDATPP